MSANGDFINWANANIGNLDVKIDDFNSWVLQLGPISLDVLSKISDIDLEEFTYYSCSK